MDTIFFMDSDIVVVGNLEELQFFEFDSARSYIFPNKINTYLENKDLLFLYAVNHQFIDSDLDRLRKLGLQGNKYFNAGIMLINLKKWRDMNISKTLIDFAEKYNEQLILWDQDVLNLVFNNKWGELDFSYNAFELTQMSILDYKIIHYTGSSKPWHFRNKHPYKKLFWKYLYKTPFYYSVLINYYIEVMCWIPKGLIKKVSQILLRK